MIRRGGKKERLPDVTERVRARLQIRFREGLNLPSLEPNYWLLNCEAGEFHCLDLFLGNADASWDVLASHSETASRETRYDVWSHSDPAERAIRNAIAEVGRSSEDGIEVLFDEPNGFLSGISKFGPGFFGVRKGSINKVLQLAEVLPWSAHRMDASKLLGGSDQFSIDMLGREHDFAEIDSKCLVVLAELLVGRSVRLTRESPPDTGAMDTAHKGPSAWLYWGR